jgi:hypothetical protein
MAKLVMMLFCWVVEKSCADIDCHKVDFVRLPILLRTEIQSLQLGLAKGLD